MRSPTFIEGNLRRRALDAAVRLLEEHGSEGLHLRTIAATINCGPASLYYHFSGKDALLGAVALEGFQGLAREMSGVVARREFVRDIDGAAAGFMRFLAQHLQLFALMYSERILTTNEAVREAEQEIVAKFQAALEGDVRIPADRREEAALAYSTFGRGVASVLLSHGAADPVAMRVLGSKIISGFALLLSTEFMLRRPDDPQ